MFLILNVVVDCFFLTAFLFSSLSDKDFKSLSLSLYFCCFLLLLLLLLDTLFLSVVSFLELEGICIFLGVL